MEIINLYIHTNDDRNVDTQTGIASENGNRQISLPHYYYDNYHYFRAFSPDFHVHLGHTNTPAEEEQKKRMLRRTAC